MIDMILSRFVALLLVISIWLCACQQIAGGTPQLIVDESVAPDLHQLANNTWQQFLLTFDARTGCFGDVTLRTSKEISERAMYDPSTAIVTVKVPASPGVLQGALVHEWAHHVEHQCADHVEMRSAFLAAQKLPPDSSWSSGDDWADIPSEQYAEAAILFVLGERTVPTEIRVSAEAVQVLRAWTSAKE